MRVELLREKLKKLKDKEVKLEADLAIREQPELEKQIIDLILTVSDLKKVDKNIKISSGVSVDVDSRLEANNRLIKFYESKIRVLRDTNKELSSGDGKYVKLREEREKLVMRLKGKFKEVTDSFDKVNFQELVPSLSEYLE